VSVQPRRQPRRPGRQRRAELSQHFLTPAAASQIVERARVARSDRVVEIGGGTGVLTRALALRAAHVTTIEIDERLAARLRRALADDSSVEVVTGDALRVALPEQAFRIVANPPFNRTADLVRRIARTASVTEAHLVVQLEAAERFAGSPYGRETLESLRLKPGWHIEIIAELPATAFSPPPGVPVALLWMLRRGRPLLRDAEATKYRAFLERVFAHRRGLRQSLGREFSAEQLRRISARLGLSLDGRRGDLTFDQWLALHRFATSQPGALTRLRWADGAQPPRGVRRSRRPRRRRRGSDRR
jgi:16S rRNA A1518/A1519 N6-dimethyltransferase RsmA/KsgA/DIM1 with predicted DNA glycosylase/AP lyase activity